jgi:hypothetical protein
MSDGGELERNGPGDAMAGIMGGPGHLQEIWLR